MLRQILLDGDKMFKAAPRPGPFSSMSIRKGHFLLLAILQRVLSAESMSALK
jgi:hypothetical protein